MHPANSTDFGYVVAGSSSSKNGDVIGNNGNGDFWIVKLSGTSNTNELQNLISNFEIVPNPISSDAGILFQLSSSKNIHVEIRDVEGRLIKNIFTENLYNGKNRIFWNTTDDDGNIVDDGIYFITLLSD